MVGVWMFVVPSLAGPPRIAGLSTQFGCTFATIKDAIVAAPTGATIYVTPGAYAETWNLISNKDLRIEPAANNTCHSAGTGRVTIDAGAANRLATISGGSLTLRNVDVVGGSVNVAFGGGQFRLLTSDLVLDHATLKDGQAGIGAGGAVRVGSGSTMTMLAGSAVSGNDAARGGGVAVDPGGSLTMAAGALMEVDLALGLAAGDGGGAIYVDGGNVTIDAGATLASNFSVGVAGAILAVGGSVVDVAGAISLSWPSAIQTSQGTLNLLPGATITDSFFDGGVVCLGCTLTATGATISGNEGGGVYADGMATVALTDTTISGNTADEGAGIYTGAPTTLTDVVIADNIASWEGGGVFCKWCDLTAVRTTFVRNAAQASVGGGIRSSAPGARATVELVDSVVDDNEANGILGGGGMYLAETDAVLNGVDLVRNADWAVGLTAGTVMTACNGTSWATGIDDNVPNDVNIDLFTANYSFPGVQSMVCDAALGTCDTTPVGCPL